MADLHFTKETVENSEIYSTSRDEQSQKCGNGQQTADQRRSRLCVERRDQLPPGEGEHRGRHPARRTRPARALFEAAWIEQKPEIKVELLQSP